MAKKKEVKKVDKKTVVDEKKYNDKVDELVAQGMDMEDAMKEAKIVRGE